MILERPADPVCTLAACNRAADTKEHLMTFDLKRILAKFLFETDRSDKFLAHSSVRRSRIRSAG